MKTIHMRGLLAAAWAIALAATTPALGHDYTVGSLTVGHPWSRATPEKARAAGAYLTIVNRGGEADRLIAVASPAADRASVHTMAMENGVMQMRPLSGGLPIGPGETVTLAPGGLHLMLNGLKAPLRQGETLPLTLTFERAGTVEVEAAIEAMGGHGAAKGGHGEGKQQ